MNDMRAVIVPKSDQINADDLIGGPRTVTVTAVSIRPGTDQPVSINFEGDNGKPYKPCKVMCRVMVQLWGPDANQYVGHSMTLYRDPAVKWGGMAVGGIRISHMSDIKSAHTMALTETKGSKKPFTVKPLDAAPVAVDRVTEGVKTLVTDIQSAPDAEGLKSITSDAAYTKQVAYLRKNRPELAAKIDAAVTAALAAFEQGEAGEPDPADDLEHPPQMEA